MAEKKSKLDEQLEEELGTEEEVDLEDEVDDLEDEDEDEDEEPDTSEESDEDDKEEDDTEETEADDEELEADSQYKSDFKYSVKGQEREIDELFRTIIKDEETEKRVIDLLTKADGLEPVKAERDRIRDEYTGFKETFMPSIELYEKGHKLEAMLKLFPAEELVEGALKIIEYNKADEHTKKQFEANIKHTFDSYEASKKNAVKDDTVSNLMAKNVELEINQSINFDNEVRDAAEWYDSLYGKGSFKKEVYNYGILNYNEKSPITPTECVGKVYEKVNKLQSLRSKPEKLDTNNTTRKVVNKNQVLSRKDKIPVIKSSGSVVRKTRQPQTFEEAKRLAMEEAELE